MFDAEATLHQKGKVIRINTDGKTTEHRGNRHHASCCARCEKACGIDIVNKPSARRNNEAHNL